MAALLVGLSVMAIMLTVAMPVWKQMSQREKEEELVFRGKQYIHAIGLFQRKVANTFPPNLDLLVEQKFLRKKFKDPITGEDFVPIPVGTAIPGQTAPTGSTGQRGTTGSSGPTGSAGPGTTASTGRGGPPATTSGPGQPGGGAGIMGVVSKSKDQSIRLYNGRGHYNEWAFTFVQAQQTPGAGVPGTANPGQRSGQPGQPPNSPFGTGNPTNPGRGRGPGSGPGPGGGPGNRGGTSPFGGGGATPILPPTRGRL